MTALSDGHSNVSPTTSVLFKALQRDAIEVLDDMRLETKRLAFQRLLYQLDHSVVLKKSVGRLLLSPLRLGERW